MAGDATGRVSLLGVQFDAVTEAEAVATVVSEAGRGRGGWVITSNLEHLRQFTADPSLADIFAEADLVVADGMPLVWTAALKGTPLPERVAGSDLVWSLAGEAALRDRSVYLLGGAPGACESAQRRLSECYPGLRLAGCHVPPPGFESDAAEMESIRQRLRAADPDIVYVALGFPKQEKLITQLRDEFPGTWFLGIGISLSFLGGDVQRAPDWVIRLGLEWLHRLAQEPRRLAKRYLLHGIPFSARLFLYGAGCRLLRKELAPPHARRGRVTAPGGDDAARAVFTHGAEERRRAEQLAGLSA